MKSNRYFIFMLISISAFAAAHCAEDSFDDIHLVKRLRILAITAKPLSFDQEDPAIRLKNYVANPAGRPTLTGWIPPFGNIKAESANTGSGQNEKDMLYNIDPPFGGELVLEAWSAPAGILTISATAFDSRHSDTAHKRVISRDYFDKAPANHNPVITRIEFDRREYQPSDEIHFSAAVTDPDGDRLRYDWYVLARDSRGELSSPSATETTYYLPAKPGIYTIWLVVRDGRGGLAAARQEIAVDGNYLAQNRPRGISGVFGNALVESEGMLAWVGINSTAAVGLVKDALNSGKEIYVYNLAEPLLSEHNFYFMPASRTVIYPIDHRWDPYQEFSRLAETAENANSYFALADESIEDQVVEKLEKQTEPISSYQYNQDTPEMIVEKVRRHYEGLLSRQLAYRVRVTAFYPKQ